jgi:hypothetical protein
MKAGSRRQRWVAVEVLVYWAMMWFMPLIVLGKTARVAITVESMFVPDWKDTGSSPQDCRKLYNVSSITGLPATHLCDSHSIDASTLTTCSEQLYTDITAPLNKPNMKGDPALFFAASA